MPNSASPFRMIVRWIKKLAAAIRRAKPAHEVIDKHPGKATGAGTTGFGNDGAGAFGKSNYYRRNNGVRGRFKYKHKLPAFKWPSGNPETRRVWLRKYRTLRKRGVLR